MRAKRRDPVDEDLHAARVPARQMMLSLTIPFSVYRRSSMSAARIGSLTQFAMMDVLVRLKGEAQAHGGDVVLVLGNHDVENAIDHHGTGSEQMADFFCNAYAPAVQDDGKASTASLAAWPASPRSTGPRCCRGWRP